MFKKILIIIFLIFTFYSNASETTPPKVAVIPFNPLGVSTEDAFGFTLVFETALQQTDVFEIVEQWSVNELLRAQEYATSQITSDDNAAKIGRLIAAEEIILGTVGSVGEQYYLNVKRIDVETGKNLQAHIIMKDSIINLLSSTSDLARSMAESASGKTIVISKKRIVRKDTYSTIGRFLYYDIYEYDETERLIFIRRYSSINRYLHYIKITYLDNGLEARRTEYEPIHKMIRYFRYEYNDKNQKTRASIYLPNNKFEQYILYAYDSEDNLQRTTTYEFTNRITGYKTYALNDQGQELVSTEYDRVNRKLNYSVSKYEDVPEKK